MPYHPLLNARILARFTIWISRTISLVLANTEVFLHDFVEPISGYHTKLTGIVGFVLISINIASTVSFNKLDSAQDTLAL